MKKQGKRRGLKIMLIVLGGLIVLIGASVAGGFALMKHEYIDRTEILKSAQTTAKKAMVVYQPSVTSASYDVAHAIGKGLHDSGLEVTISNPGRHLSADISKYSILVFGSPNYGGSVAEPLTKYIQHIDDFSNKTVILYSTSGGIAIMPELDKLAALLHGVKPYSMVKFQCNETEKNKAAAYQLGIDAARQ